VEPLIVVAAGLAALGGGALVLRSFGPGYRVGRLLASTPRATIEEAEAVADSGRPRYLRIDGRLDSDEDFPDEHERPLVYRRRRLEARRGRRWVVLDQDVQLVPFEVRAGLAALAIDGGGLAEGLVVLPRESVGTAAEVPDRVPAGTPPATPLRYRIEQVSAVEHATVLGVPTRGPDGRTMLGAGLGRPLILSTVEPTEAMQLLAGGRRGRPIAAIGLLAAGVGLVALGLAWAVVQALAATMLPGPVLAATPSASPGIAGDTRSAGEGPGLVGAPLLAIGIVGLIALLAVVATLVYVRVTAGRDRDGAPRG
jgi:hypothetical protein